MIPFNTTSIPCPLKEGKNPVESPYSPLVAQNITSFLDMLDIVTWWLIPFASDRMIYVKVNYEDEEIMPKSPRVHKLYTMTIHLL